MDSKKQKNSQRATNNSTLRVLNDDNLLYEILKNVEARDLANSACVNMQWKATTCDERLWEIICTRHWVNIGCAEKQLRNVVLALGGFRILHKLYLWPLSSPGKSRVGKDEIQLSLSMLSVKYFEKMNSGNKRKAI